MIEYEKAATKDVQIQPCAATKCFKIQQGLYNFLMASLRTVTSSSSSLTQQSIKMML